ncbi:DUF998 domain-containing protein [Pseudoxanthomonas sp. UTMC 1351]|uniref:DUF998 domain-containing protein n=1 Tax=Pseudoxanthomonas sp. UTMC 1351 TaxID=2695853 RepID=UPI0034CF484F
MNRGLPYLGLAGAVLFAAAVIGFGLALPGYSQSAHPVAVLGAKGFPHATMFNLLGFVLPGLLASVVMLELRLRLPGNAGWMLRIGAQLLLLSSLGFVALGVLPLDPADLHNKTSSYHATAWMLWWVAFVPGAALLASGLRGQMAWRTVVRISAIASLLLLVLVLFAVDWLPAGTAQRVAFAVWWVWMCITGLTPRAALTNKSHL